MTFNTFASGINTTFSSKLNENFNECRIMRKVFTASSEFSTTNSVPQDITNGSFTIVNTSGSGMLLGARFFAELQCGGSENATLYCKVTGANLGTSYIRQGVMHADEGVNPARFAPMFMDSEVAYMLLNGNDTYDDSALSGFLGVALLDTSTTFTFQLAAPSGSLPAYVRNLRFDLIYTTGFTDV